MHKDKRHALGSGSEDEDFGKNRLPMKFPYDQGSEQFPPLSDDAGTPNPAINKRRPIARMHPNGGNATLYKGIAFGWPMGERDDS